MIKQKKPKIPSIDDSITILIICCQSKHSKIEHDFLLNYFSQGSYTFQHILNLASKHGVLPLVYQSIHHMANTHHILKPFEMTLKSAYLQIVKKNMRMSIELIYITKLLKTHGIDSLTFKGPVLSKIAYGDITLRQYGDIDILIKKRDRLKMILLLENEGYIPEIQLKTHTKETFIKAVNVIAFYHKSSKIRIEIHWELLSKNYAVNWHEDTLWENNHSIQINNNHLPILTIELHLIYLCVHSAKHLYERIEWICDIDRLIRSNANIDWNYILYHSKKMGITRMLYLGLTLSYILFDLEIPNTVQKHINKDTEIPKLINKIIKINFSNTSKSKKGFYIFRLLLNMRENHADKVKLFYKGITTAKFDDFLFLQLPKPLTFLYPIVRLFRLIKKYSKL